MFDHVTIRVADREASERFYTALLENDNPYSGEHVAEWGNFSLAAATAATPATSGLSIVLRAKMTHCARPDPDGNHVETVDGGPAGGIARLHLTVTDLAASTRFYECIAPFTGASDELTLAAGATPTRNVHLAFPAAGNATVDAFHAAALAAGYRDNGAPGDRAVYHAGYYAAFVVDPDGNNVELVNHNRADG